MRVSELRVSDPEKKGLANFFVRLFPKKTEKSEFQSFGHSCPQPIKVGPSDLNLVIKKNSSLSTAN
jgi:hypothetical protein